MGFAWLLQTRSLRQARDIRAASTYERHKRQETSMLLIFCFHFIVVNETASLQGFGFGFKSLAVKCLQNQSCD